MAAVINSVMCARCQKLGHLSKDCSMPFMRTSTAADRRAEAAKKKAAWEARQVEAAAKKAEWQAKQAEWEAKQAEAAARWAARQSKQKAWDLESNCTEETLSTAEASTEAFNEEVERLAIMDKEVRKFVKVLRDIEKLESQQDLDPLQRAKVARKHDVELDLVRAKGIALGRARRELMQQDLV
jgi:hypothetical protein